MRFLSFLLFEPVSAERSAKGQCRLKVHGEKKKKTTLSRCHLQINKEAEVSGEIK